MLLTQSDHFRAYIERTGRSETWARRKKLVHELNEHYHQSIQGLVASVGGNSRDRVWVSQAIRDGEITRHPEHGSLRLRQQSGITCEEVVRRAAELAAEAQALLDALPEPDDTDPDDEAGMLVMRAARALQLVCGSLDENDTEWWRGVFGLASRSATEQDDREEGDEES